MLKPGDIVITKTGEKHKITAVNFLEYVEGGQLINYDTDRGGVQLDQIDCLIGMKCDRCENDLIFNEGYYRREGQNICIACGDRVTV